MSGFCYSQKIKVACIGDSVTYGAGIDDRDQNCYPAQLQKLLGDTYEVQNFGYSGATALKNGHKPYVTKSVYKESLEFQPDIAIIHLGLNDQGMNNWPAHGGEFVQDYMDLIESYKSLASKPKIIICRMTPTFSGHHWFEEGMRESFKEIQDKIEQIAEKATISLVDLHDPLYRFPEYFPDNLHPTKEGAAVIANKTFQAITGDHGGLNLPVLYGDGMVLQRDQPMKINGNSNPGDHIEIDFNGSTAKTTVSSSGKWNLSLPSQKAGGPFNLEIRSAQSDNVIFKNVYVGEVWVASGQSNMAFETKHSKHAESILKDSINPHIQIFNFRGNAMPVGKAFDEDELKKCNASSYFKPSGWQTATTEIVKDFSAIAYAFAFNLQKELNVPVGIIHNAIGGSTTQSWISRETMESRHETVDLLNDTHKHPMVQAWTEKRKAENFQNKKKLKVKARHPFDPTMLFDAGIYPITNYNINGVIWYQGESNAERPEFHKMLFKMLVNDWRSHWEKPEMPFYFVQLSSIERKTWGQFRDSQRSLLFEIPATGMAVSSDVGNPKDVHPKRKWIVGERLSRIALNQTTNKQVPFSGPLFDYLNIENNKLMVHFKHVNQLKTVDNTAVKDLFIAGEDQVFVKAVSKLNGNVLEVWSAEVPQPRFIKYGYSPYTNGNLINEAGLPASTFSNLNSYEPN